jgi:hypothetical protein
MVWRALNGHKILGTVSVLGATRALQPNLISAG